MSHAKAEIPSAHSGQWLSSYPHHHPPTSLTCLEWVQMCDPHTLPLLSPYLSHRAQQELAHSFKSCWPKCHHTQSHRLGDATAKCRTFNTQDDLMGCHLTTGTVISAVILQHTTEEATNHFPDILTQGKKTMLGKGKCGFMNISDEEN